MNDSAVANNGGPLRRKVVITNPHGFHLRPIQAFVELALQFQSQIQVSREGRQPVNGKSPWDLLSLAAEQGTEFTVEVEGPDGPNAIDALVDLLVNLESRVKVDE
jgi:phosphotransferase system HPr (HPr) family protein